VSNSTRRLPARPSLERLRKQAKALLRDYRDADVRAVARFTTIIPRLSDPSESAGVTLADAQFVLAREYGFESWAHLARQVEFINPPDRLQQYERLVKDIVTVCQSDDAEALQRLADTLGRTHPYPDRRTRLQQILTALRGPESRIADITTADAQLILAREFGFESWEKLVDSVAQPPADPQSSPQAPHGMSATPPFYKIDRRENRIELRPPISDRDWDTIFAVMKEQRITELNAGGQMTDAAMERLPQLDFVTRLGIGGSKRLTDDGLQHLARMPQLQELDMSEYPGGQITDRGLEALRHLTELRRFQICWQSGVTDAGMANLAFCDNLEEVNLMGTPTGDGAIQTLTGKRHLRRFKTGRLVTNAGLPLFHNFPMFKTWQNGEIKYDLMAFDAEPTDLLLDGPFTDEGMEFLEGLDGLFGLNFFWHVSALTPAGLKPLAGLANLGFLGCHGELCNDEAMRHIAAIPRLRMLMGQGTVASDIGFTSLSRSQTIEYIWGRECPNLGGRGFTALAAMPALKGLAVSCKNVDDAALSSLPRFPSLRGLLPMDALDAAFRHIGRCERLESLWCMYCRDTGDEATGYITGLSELKTYYAGATQITDRSLEILGRMPSIESLEFWECGGISDAGLAHLASLPRLRKISVGGSPRVTRAGLAIFPPTVQVN
jgi:hypothetical protein